MSNSTGRSLHVPLLVALCIWVAGYTGAAACPGPAPAAVASAFFEHGAGHRACDSGPVRPPRERSPVGTGKRATAVRRLAVWTVPPIRGPSV